MPEVNIKLDQGYVVSHIHFGPDGKVETRDFIIINQGEKEEPVSVSELAYLDGKVGQEPVLLSPGTLEPLEFRRLTTPGPRMNTAGIIAAFKRRHEEGVPENIMEMISKGAERPPRTIHIIKS